MARRRSYRLVTFCCFAILISAFAFGYYINSPKDLKNEYTAIPQLHEDIPKTIRSEKLTVGDMLNDEPTHEGGEGETLENIDPTESVSNDPAKQRISINTRLIFKTQYTECQHEEINEDTVSEEMVNLTEDELKALYDDCEIQIFSKEQIVLSRKIDGKCQKHYIVKEYEGKVGLFYQTDVQDKKSFIKSIDYINLQQLRQDDREKIKKGILIESDEELAQLIEDFNS